nr:MAG TPA: hypothetical protein [Caudoviricetes sp.]
MAIYRFASSSRSGGRRSTMYRISLRVLSASCCMLSSFCSR